MELTQQGYHDLDDEAIERRLRAGDYQPLVRSAGNFTIAASEGEQTWIVTSAYSLFSYYYTQQHGQFVHSQSLLEVLRQGGLDWEWNIPALADLFELQHLLDDDTLHPHIQRVPQGAVVHFDGQTLSVHRFADTDLPSRPVVPDSAGTLIDIFNAEVDRWTDSPTPLLSMSGGFDARAILSSLLHAGRKPQLLVMGSAKSTDVAISQAIARRYSLPLQRVEVDESDYIKYGPEIMQVCDGAQPAMHWHAHIYLVKAGLDRQPIFIGTNGELARTTFFDKGILSHAADLGGRLLVRKFWNVFNGRRMPFSPAEGGQLAPGFNHALLGPGRKDRLDRVVALSRGRVLSKALDMFYLEQRVKRFTSNGVRLASRSFTPILPFLSADWIETSLTLPLSQRVASAWHRQLMKANCPGLLDFPEMERSARMARKAQPFYWVKHPWRPRVVGYNSFLGYSRRKDTMEYLCDRRELLDDIIEPALIVRIAEEHHAQGNRKLAVSQLLALVTWMEQVRECDQATQAPVRSGVIA